MRFRFWLVLLGFAVGGVLAPVAASGATGLPPRAEVLAGDLRTARELLERSLEWRGRAERYLEATGKKIDGGTLSSADLTTLYAGAEDYVFLSRRWRALVDVQGEEAWARAAPMLNSDALARTQTKLALAAALVEHDDYAIGVEPYFQITKLRRLLKTDRPSIEGEIEAATLRFLSPANRQRLARAVVWHRAEGALAAERSADEAFLDEVIAQSPAYVFFSKRLSARLVNEWKAGGYASVAAVTDSFSTTGKSMTHVTSMAVGNTLGLVESRSGYLRELDAETKAALQGRLRPLDVLLEKTPFRLTDKSIPGHYGHVAVWVGNEAELRALGLWDDPLVKPHQERIRQGACIVEALRPGVELNTLEHFLNIDELLVIRSRAAMAPEETAKNVKRAFAQIGKEYDFNFDVESDRRIVCSELAYVVFPEIAWPTSRMLGRQSISPDQVAVKALPDGPFAPEILFFDGVEIREKIPETLAALLKEDGNAFRALHPGFEGRSGKGGPRWTSAPDGVGANGVSRGGGRRAGRKSRAGCCRPGGR